MSQLLAKKQFDEALQATGKLEGWKLKEIRRELKIGLGDISHGTDSHEQKNQTTGEDTAANRIIYR